MSVNTTAIACLVLGIARILSLTCAPWIGVPVSDLTVSDASGWTVSWSGKPHPASINTAPDAMPRAIVLAKVTVTPKPPALGYTDASYGGYG